MARYAIIVDIMPKTQPPLVAILAYDGLCTFEYGCAVEIFKLYRPEMGEAWYRAIIVAGERGELRGLGGIRVDAEAGLEALQEAETIVVPGWRDPAERPPQPMLDALTAAHERGCRLVAICGGAFVLAATGLLDRKRATTHWHHLDRLRKTYPAIRVEPNVLYVDEGTLLTSAGSAAGLDLLLHIIRRDFGASSANRVARRMVVAAHRGGGQAQFVEQPVPKREAMHLSRLVEVIRSKLDFPWTIDTMAAEAGVSVRSLHRHLTTTTGSAPGAWLIQQRVSRACELLESTNHSIDEVAHIVGFGSGATLRQHFRHGLGVSPSDYRRQFTLLPAPHPRVTSPSRPPAPDGDSAGP